ncbi:MAG: hypothetical protein AAGH87_04250 [Pseudomonadota bacterium]
MSCLNYTFRPSQNRAAQTWSLDGQFLSDGTSGEIRLEHIRGGSFSDLPSGPHWVSCLVLDHARGSVKISCRDSVGGASRREYMAMVVALLGDLAAVRPDAAFRSGGGRLMTYGLVAVGAALALVGGYAVAGGAFGLFDEGSQFAIYIGALSSTFGLFLGWTGSPWMKPTTRTPGDLLDWLQTWLERPV